MLRLEYVRTERTLFVIPAKAGIQGGVLDSGSRLTALPGMTGCHECRAGIEDFVSEQRSEESL